MAALFCTLGTAAEALDCFYPDGTVSDVDIPCPNSKQCCPLDWQCMSNGLCHYKPLGSNAPEQWERRTCTDPDWKHADCPKFCTYSAGGNEAVKICGDYETFCCAGNGSLKCCDGEFPAETSLWPFDNGTIFATIGATAATAASGTAVVSNAAATSSVSTTSAQPSTAAVVASTCACLTA